MIRSQTEKYSLWTTETVESKYKTLLTFDPFLKKHFYITKNTIKQQTLDWRNIFVTHFTNEAFRIYREIKSIYNNTNQCENINNVSGKKCANSVTKKNFF